MRACDSATGETGTGETGRNRGETGKLGKTGGKLGTLPNGPKLRRKVLSSQALRYDGSRGSCGWGATE